MEEALNQYKVQNKFEVHWGDMDAANHVNNLIYLRWSESARMNYFVQMGMDNQFAGKVAPILGWQDCKYIFPVKYPDTILIGMRTTEIQADRIMMECSMFSEKHQRIVALSHQRVIPYHYVDLKKVEVPEEWKHQIKRVEGWS